MKDGDDRCSGRVHDDSNPLHAFAVVGRYNACEGLQFEPADHQRDTTTANGGLTV